jgi:hypothetical protein
VARKFLPTDEYARILKEQEGYCAICRMYRVGHPLRPDYDATTKIVRGLLCDRCSRIIYTLWESPQVLRQAIGYLERFGRV